MIKNYGRESAKKACRSSKSDWIRDRWKRVKQPTGREQSVLGTRKPSSARDAAQRGD